MVTLLHNGTCSKSLALLQYLEQNSIAFRVRNYLEDPLSRKELQDLLEMLHGNALQLIRKEDPFFIENFSYSEMSEEQCIDILVTHPKLMQRPVIIRGNNAIIARPIEAAIDFLKI